MHQQQLRNFRGTVQNFMTVLCCRYTQEEFLMGACPLCPTGSAGYEFSDVSSCVYTLPSSHPGPCITMMWNFSKVGSSRGFIVCTMCKQHTFACMYVYNCISHTHSSCIIWIFRFMSGNRNLRVEEESFLLNEDGDPFCDGELCGIVNLWVSTENGQLSSVVVG